jgi:hypothetical protein
MAVAVSQADRGSPGGFVVEAAFCPPPFTPEVGGADQHRAPFRYRVLHRGLVSQPTPPFIVGLVSQSTPPFIVGLVRGCPPGALGTAGVHRVIPDR